jgi:hypothetical protein
MHTVLLQEDADAGSRMEGLMGDDGRMENQRWWLAMAMAEWRSLAAVAGGNNQSKENFHVLMVFSCFQ